MTTFFALVLLTGLSPSPGSSEESESNSWRDLSGEWCRDFLDAVSDIPGVSRSLLLAGVDLV